MCIISTAQQARPKVIGHMDPLRPQLAMASRVVAMYSPAFVFCTLSSVPSAACAGAGAALCDMARDLRRMRTNTDEKHAS